MNSNEIRIVSKKDILFYWKKKIICRDAEFVDDRQIRAIEL